MSQFQIKIAFDKVSDEGKEVRGSLEVVVNAETFTEAEALAYECAETESLHAIFVQTIKRVSYTEIHVRRDIEINSFFIVTILIANDYGKLVRQKLLINSETSRDAEDFVTELFKNTTLDFKVFSITESKIESYIINNEEEEE
jgi:hypothetical protein